MSKKIISFVITLALLLGYMAPVAEAINYDNMQSATPLVLDTPVNVSITSESRRAYFSFTPATDCRYVLTSSDSAPEAGIALYNSSGTKMSEDGRTGTTGFSFRYNLSSGVTYYYELYYNDSVTGTFSMYVTAEHEWIKEYDSVLPTCITEGTHTWECSCGATKNEPIPMIDHEYFYEWVFDSSEVKYFKKYTCRMCGRTYTESDGDINTAYLFDFEDEDTTGWTFVDGDGDGESWEPYFDEECYLSQRTYPSNLGSLHVMSSWNYANFTDDWAITPSFSLEEYPNATAVISISTPDLTPHLKPVYSYEVYAGTDNDPEKMVKVADVSCGRTVHSNVNYYEISYFDLSSFKGQSEVYFAVRNKMEEDTYMYISSVKILVPPCDPHDLTVHPEESPTCTETGIREYYECNRCGRLYSDEACENEITSSDLTLPALGHDFGDYHSNGDGTHSKLCSRCEETETYDCEYTTVSGNGVVIKTCSVCGDNVYEPITGTQALYSWGFEPGEEAWTFIDEDGDGHTWINYNYSFHEGSHCISSGDSSQGNTSNWAVSPAFSLVSVDESSVSVWVKRSLTDTEEFEIYAGTSNQPFEMVKISGDTPIATESSFVQYTADLSAFGGESEVYVAIRHCSTSTRYSILLDDVEILYYYPESCTVHEIRRIPAVDATCVTGGHLEYFYCEICNRLFLDWDGEKYTTLEGVKTSGALGHSWSEYISDGEGSHSRTCSVCGETEEDNCTMKEIVESGRLYVRCEACGYCTSNELLAARWNFDDDADYYNWIFIDGDGDGNTWTKVSYKPYEGIYHLRSRNDYVKEPDNWAISPAFSLEGMKPARVSFYACKPSTSTEEFTVYAGTSSDPDAMVVISGDSPVSATTEYLLYSFDLSQFSGESQVYLAIRHTSLTSLANQSYLYVDNIKITGEEYEPYFDAHSLSLDGNVSVNFYLDLTPEEAENATVSFSWYTKTLENVPVTLDTLSGRYRASCPVAAAEMSCPITATLYLDGVLQDETDVYSVKEYAEVILSEEYEAAYTGTGSQSYENLRELVLAMLDYGTRSQEKFDRYTEVPANGGTYTYGDPVDPDEIPVVMSDMYVNLEDYGLEHVGTTLVHLSETSLRHYYRITDEDLFDAVKDNITFGGKKVNYVEKGSQIYFELSNIGAQFMGTPYVLHIGLDDYSYAVTDYIRNYLLRGTSDETKAVVSAMYNYYLRASIFTGNLIKTW